MKITQRQLRQIIRESLENYLLSEKEPAQQPEKLTVSDLSLAGVNILDGEHNLYKFVAKVRPNVSCDWRTATRKKGDTTISEGTVEGVVDLGKVAKAIGKTGKIQRQAISRFFYDVFGYFSVTGTVASLSEATLTFGIEDGLIIKTENKTNAIKVEHVVLKTEGLTNDGEEIELPSLPDNKPEPLQEPEPQQEPEPLQEPEMENEPLDFEQSLSKQGFRLDGNKIYTSDNQWVATYYDKNNSVMTFADLAGAPFVSALKAACTSAGVRFVEQ